jgi:hypothetical protein
MLYSSAFTVRNHCYRFATASSFYKQIFLPAMDGYCAGTRKNRSSSVGGRCNELRPATVFRVEQLTGHNADYAGKSALAEGE